MRAGEGITALLMTLNVFFLLTAYYVIKPVRKGLILSVPGGSRYESYLSAAIAVSLLVAVPAYARFADRLPKNKLVVGVTLFFVSHIVVFFGLSYITPIRPYLAFVFFVWVGIFNMMVVAQFWAFANDLYTQEQGKRLFALLGLGASVGAAVGAWFTGILKKSLGGTSLGVYPLLLVSAAMLALCALLSHLAHVRERGKKDDPVDEPKDASAGKAKTAKEPKTKDGAFQLVLRNKYLLLIAVFSLVFTWVNTNGEFMMSASVERATEEAAKAAGKLDPKDIAIYVEGETTSIFADFYIWVNVLGVAIQTFAVSRIVKFGGLRVAFFILPLIALLDAGGVLLLPALLGMKELDILRPGKIAENATDYSVNNTVRNMLWLPTSTEMKYKAKQAVDTFFVRMGDVASGLAVFIVTQIKSWPVPTMAAINVALVGVWLYVARGIVRENGRLADEKERQEDASHGDAKTT